MFRIYAKANGTQFYKEVAGPALNTWWKVEVTQRLVIDKVSRDDVRGREYLTLCDAQFVLQLTTGGGTGARVILCKINSQPEILTDVRVRAGHADYPAVSGSIRNLRYEAVSATSFSMVMLERSYYSGTKNSPIDGANHKPLYAIDDQVDHSQVTGNYRSKPGYTKPFIELALSQAVDIAGLEVTTFGAANIRRFEKVIFRAGMVMSPVGGPGSGNNLLSHNPFVMEYVDKAYPGEVIYLTFPHPLTARYILIQGNANPADTNPTNSVILELAEVRIIKCEYHTVPYCPPTVPIVPSGVLWLSPSWEETEW